MIGADARDSTDDAHLRADPTDAAPQATGQNPARPPQALWSERYDLLDAWRGIAALTVVLYHLEVVPFGHHAVMLFFVISGYCIAAAAESGLRKGIGFRRFMWRRVRRIYPPYLLSVLIFSATRLTRYLTTGERFDKPLHVWLQNLTLTQWLSLLRHPLPFAALNPTNFLSVYWSLGYEEQFYLVVAVVLTLGMLVHRRNVLIGLMLIALAWNVIAPKVVTGFFIEYWSHFAIGALLFYRLCRMKSARQRLAADVMLFALAAVTCYLAWRSGPMTLNVRPVWLELAICSVFALLLRFARPLNDAFKRSHLGRALMALGLISYSLYLVHQFNQHLAYAISLRILPIHQPKPLNVTIQICIHLILATIFWYFCERPFLNRSTVPGERLVTLPTNPLVNLTEPRTD